MILADWIILALLLIFALLGMLLGFGKGLKIFTGGIFGVAISIFVCYAVGGLIINIGFIQSALMNMRSAIAAKDNGFCDFLLTIHIDIIVYYVALFIIVQILRIIIVRIIASIAEINNIVLIIFNKTLGIVLFLGVLTLLTLLVFQMIYLISGGVESSFYTSTLAGSKLKLDWLYEHNPFMTIIKVIRIELPVKL